MGTTPFERQTSVEAVAGHPGRYRAEVTDEWSAPVLPQGGVMAALALRAMADVLGEPEKRLRSVTTVFAAQVVPGPVEIDVDVLRRGRAMSQVTATLRPEGAEAGHTSLAVFGVRRPGFEFTDVAFPAVPGPEACRSIRDPLPEGILEHWPWRRPSFWQHVEMRFAVGHAPWEDWVPTTSECAVWMHFDEPPLADAGHLDPLALVALCDTMPSAVAERMGPGHAPWMAPSADLTVHLLGDVSSEWVLARKRARWAGEGYASLELELWDSGGHLAAYGTQMMMFRFPEGPPPAHRVRPPA